MKLVIYMTAMIMLIIVGVYLVLCGVSITVFSWKFAGWYTGISLILILVFIRGVIRNYLAEKFKLIFKTIHNLKLTKEEKRNRKIDMSIDMMAKVEQEVKGWAESKRSEIEQLRKLESFRREFLGNVTHELRTPLSNLQSYINELTGGDREFSEEMRTYLDKAQDNIDQMAQMVEELEVISRLESGEMQLDESNFDLYSLCRETYEHMQAKAAERSITLKFGADTNMGLYVYADRDRIRKVIENLVANSIQYGIENGRTKISVYDMDENYLVEVSDNGIGVEEKHLSRLFERFYRVDRHRFRSQGGTGLGLAIVKHIVEAHGQTINVRSTQGLGSTFSFTIRKS
jgi:two-component system phosphate regulon sensor histidine kinase PhoR